jgi:hypothetical protein
LLQIDIAKIVVHEADEPNVLADLLEADALTGEDGAEIDLLAIEADAPAPGDGDGPVVEWVIEQLLRPQSREKPQERNYGASRLRTSWTCCNTFAVFSA